MAANTCNQPPFFGNGTGAVADYTFGFEFINRADVEVYVGEPGNWTQFTEGNAANANEFQWQSDTVIRLNAATGTDNVLITRETDRCDPAVEFFAGTSIRAEDLNANQEQTLFLIQELAETLEQNGMDQPPGSDGITLDDLEDVNITTPANPSWLRWNGTEWQDQPILEDGDTWVADDNHVVTSAAGDDRWLGIPGQGGTTITAGSGLEMTGTPATVVEVDLADTTPGLQFDANDDLQVIGNSVTRTGGTNVNPNITNGPSNITITGGQNITVTRNSDNELTIASTSPTGGATFRGTVEVDNDNTLPATTGQQNPDAVAIGDGFTVENNVAAANVTANWNTVITNWDTGDGIINSGDVIICTTAAAAGSPTDARYSLIRTGGNINTLQQVTTAGNETTNNIQMSDGAGILFENDAETFTVELNADDCTASYNITLPPAAPAAGTRYLRAAGTETGANQELEWATGGGGATGGNTATEQDYVFQENAQRVRHDYTVGTTLAAQPGSGVTTGTCNALSAGPVTINNGVTVTIENGSNWVVI